MSAILSSPFIFGNPLPEGGRHLWIFERISFAICAFAESDNRLVFYPVPKIDRRFIAFLRHRIEVAAEDLSRAVVHFRAHLRVENPFRHTKTFEKE